MVDLNAGSGPEMTEIDGVQYRPEHVEAARAASEARKSFPAGAVDPTPIGVPAPTDNRRRTVRELNEDAGETAVDPASTILSRESAPDVGAPVAKPTRKRADAGE